MPSRKILNKPVVLDTTLVLLMEELHSIRVKKKPFQLSRPHSLLPTSLTTSQLPVKKVDHAQRPTFAKQTSAVVP